MGQTITIIGAGYVGLSTAALMANSGHTVHLIEINPERLSIIKSGRSFFFEEGIDALIARGIKQKTLLPSDSYSPAIQESSVIFSCVGTPDNPDGSSNLDYVFAAAKETAKHIKPGSIYVQKSTVPVETGKRVKELFANEKVDVRYVSNPEFLREGTAIADTLWFDRIVCGSEHSDAIQEVFNLYKSLEKEQENLAKISGIKSPKEKSSGQYVATGLESAELIKVTANAFLATKISFANAIAKLADSVDADINEVMDGVGMDKRIGRAFLNAGRGYGGGCFPKDMSGLIDVMNEHNADATILTAAQDVNASMPGYVVNQLKEALGELNGVTVAVLGLAFKAGTSDARRSPAVKIANMLDKLGAKVTAYDPAATDEAREDLRTGVQIARSTDDAIKHATIAILATEWPEFKNTDFSKLEVLVDAMNMLDEPPKNVRYFGVGRK